MNADRVDDVYFARLSFGRLELEQALEHYLCWVLGQGEFARLRERRMALGIDPSWTQATLSEGGAFRGTNGCRVGVRREGRAVSIRLVHADEASASIEWHSLAKLRLAGERTELEHGAGRLVERGTVLEPVAAAPAVLTSLLERSGIELEPGELRATAPVSHTSSSIPSFVERRLLSPERAAPIAVLAPSERGETLVDPVRMSRALRGVATVCCIADAAAAAGLERAIGDPMLGCPLGAARLYHPLAGEEPAPDTHPVWPASRVLRFPPRRRTTALAAEMISDISRRNLPAGFFDES